jgi:CubicO group peptidase (beta-lactamase class C family)
LSRVLQQIFISGDFILTSSTSQLLATAKQGHTAYPIYGHVSPGFESVLTAFINNFERGEEVGASAAITHRGKLVVDLWGGYKDRAKTTAWESDTIVCMMSVCKAAAATTIFHAVEQGLIDLNRPIAHYWPEFAANGKEKIPLQWVLDHRSGLPVVEPRLPKGSIYDHQEMCDAFARMTPLWQPGQQAGYHILSQGFLLAEVLRRVSGLSMGIYFDEHIAQPLGLDYHIGVPEDHLKRCAEYCMVTDGTILDEAAKDPNSWQGRAWYQLAANEDFNSRAWRTSEIASANGHGNARAIATLFGMLCNGGQWQSKKILNAESVSAMMAEQHNLTEVVMGRSYHQASGVLRNSPPICFQGPNPKSFGHHGVGGSIGMGDIEHQLSFSYGMNQMHARKDNGPRAGTLIQAAYQSIGVICPLPDYSSSPVAGWLTN